MPTTIRMSEHAEWESYGLDGLESDRSDYEQYCNQRPDYADSLAGDVFSAPDRTVTGPDGTEYRVIFTSSFSNSHSPWASHYTSADLYRIGDDDDAAEYAKDRAHYESMPEYLESDDDDSDDELDDDDDDSSPAGWDSIEADDESADDVPNLDAMQDTAELNDASIAIRSNPRIPRDVVELLDGYCEVKISAIRFRLAGRINEALQLEAECDRLYQSLPERYRW